MMDPVAIGMMLRPVVPFVAKELYGRVKSYLNPSELEAALKAGLQEADRQHEAGTDPSKMLFRRFDPTKEKHDFLQAAFQHSGALTELQKPLEGKGTPDVACLMQVFLQVEKLSGAENFMRSQDETKTTLEN